MLTPELLRQVDDARHVQRLLSVSRMPRRRVAHRGLGSAAREQLLEEPRLRQRIVEGVVRQRRVSRDQRIDAAEEVGRCQTVLDGHAGVKRG